MHIRIRREILLLLAVALFVSGCAQPKSLYNYNDYSERYYKNKKDVNETTTLELQQSIEKAIEEVGKSRSGRVPPGMYANLGYMYLKAGRSKEALECFKNEKSIYPESTHFMDRIIKKVELEEGVKK